MFHSSRVKIANGSASLGRIASVDVFGENIVVVWEFGRVGIFEVGRGRVTEVCELKTGIGSLKSAWGIRRVKDKAEVLAMLSRTSATDILSMILASSITPFTTLSLPTTDAQSLAWSPAGKWLSVLDSPLSAPNSAVHIYTADGNFYRSYPPTSTTPVEETFALGPLRQVWGPNHLALANADGSITLLSTTTFSPAYTLEPWTVMEEDISAVYREQVSSKGDRNWAYLGTGDDTTSQLLSSYSPALEMKFDAAGKFLAFRLETFPETVVVWHIPSLRPMFASTTQDDESEADNKDHNTILLFHHHTTVKKLQWHPTISGLLLTHTEDNQIYLSSTSGETNAPLHLSHPFATPTSSSTSTPSINDLLAVHWITSTTILVTTRKRGWVIVSPFGAPSAPSSPVAPRLKEGEDHETHDETMEDSLYDILSGRTPLPALRISDDYLPEDSEVEGEEADGAEDGFNDTFRGKGTAGTVGSFEY
ncbi:hypothetical protein E4T52_16520 [Aureobasidium sp. EXF-3400]|nr:hypothetical protein E4T51_15816 [Aureobasidium sp. EXF-12344]KAI4768388.1 hypothetical protein E4T52_16520 [Aureobasidium sp. EXF-3400]